MTDQTIVLITGANSGIGYAASKIIACASPEYHVLVAGRSMPKVEAAVKELQSENEIKGKLTPLLLDVNSEESVTAAVQTVEQEFGRVDVLINNAGTAGLTSGSLKEQSDAILETNVTGPLVVSHAFTSLLSKSKKPYSIFVSSTLGSLGMTSDPEKKHYYNDNYQVYRMSKSALNMIAITELHRLSPKGIKVFVMCPGLVRSNLRGSEEHQVSAGGNAISADTSGQTLLSIVEGKRDADEGKFMTKDGLNPW